MRPTERRCRRSLHLRLRSSLGLLLRHLGQLLFLSLLLGFLALRDVLFTLVELCLPLVLLLLLLVLFLLFLLLFRFLLVKLLLLRILFGFLLFQLIFEILDIVQFPVELVDLPLQFVVVLFLRSQLLLQLLILAALRWIGTHVAYGERHSSNEDDAYPLLPCFGLFRMIRVAAAGWWITRSIRT